MENNQSQEPGGCWGFKKEHQELSWAENAAEVQLRAAILHSWKITSYYLFTAYHLVHVAEKDEMCYTIILSRAENKELAVRGHTSIISI